MNIETKICSRCRLEKEINNFYFHKDRGSFRAECKACTNESVKRYNNKNKEKIKQDKKKYGAVHKEELKSKHKIYYENNKETIFQRHKMYDEVHKEERKIYHNDYRKQKRQNDPVFRLRCLVSCAVCYLLKKQDSKKDNPTWEKLFYSPEQLKEHLEKLWEPWMSWENHGKSDLNKRTWQIDHIVPQSLLLYDSLDHPNFQKCWALENLRPLETQENMKKGNKII